MNLKDLLKRGFRFKIFSDGPAFDPAEQERKDGFRDISEKKQKEAENVVDR